jgi:hypothetical protein
VLASSAAEPAEEVDATIAGALSAPEPAARAAAARAAELRGRQTLLPPLRTAAESERRAATRADMKRAIAALRTEPAGPKPHGPDRISTATDAAVALVDAALATLDDPLPAHVPKPDSLPALVWHDGTDVAAASRHGLLAALTAEDETGPSPLAHRAARLLHPAAAHGWGAALFLERPKLNTRADAFRAHAALVLLDDERLLAYCRRVLRRTAHPLHRRLPELLARRDTPGAREAATLFSGGRAAG